MINKLKQVKIGCGYSRSNYNDLGFPHHVQWHQWRKRQEAVGDGGSPGQVATPASVIVPMKMGKCSGNKIGFTSERCLVQIPASALSSCVTLDFLSAFLFSIVEIMPLFQGCCKPQLREWALSLTGGHLMTPQDVSDP